MRTYTRKEIETAGGWTSRQLRERIFFRLMPPADGPRCCPIYTDKHLRRARDLRELESAPRTLAAIARDLNRARIVKITSA